MADTRRQEKPPVVLVALAAATAVLLCAALYLIFAVAPVELQMGIVQKIFYFHVPSAIAMYVGFGFCFIGSVGYLWRRTPKWDALGVAGAEVGLLFCVIVLITGPLWARKAWGHFWVWDPQLTTTLLAAMVFMAYVVLRGFGTGSEAEKKFAAGLGVVGVLDLPIIHFSVRMWSGQHPTVIRRGGGGMHPDMKMAFAMSLAAFTALVVLLLWVRVRVGVMRQRVEAIETEAAERGLLEDA